MNMVMSVSTITRMVIKRKRSKSTSNTNMVVTHMIIHINTITTTHTMVTLIAMMPVAIILKPITAISTTKTPSRSV